MHKQQGLNTYAAGNYIMPFKKPQTIASITTKPDVYEYLLTAEADATVSSLVQQEKEIFNRHYRDQTSQHVKNGASITVASFWAHEGMEDTIIRWLQRICGQQESFPVMLNNYSGFPPDRIFLRIQDPQPFQKLATQLNVIDSYISGCGLPAANIMVHPHITIARKIPESIYTKVMMDFATRDFNESFMVKELLLLKRKHKEETCKKVNVFKLSTGNAH